MLRSTRSPGAAPLALALWLVAAAPAAAGVVVLDNGAVFVGQLRAPQGDRLVLVLDDPLAGQRPTVTFTPGEVRWFDPLAGELTEAYWQAHLRAPLRDPALERERQRRLDLAEGRSVPDPYRGIELDPPALVADPGGPLAERWIALRGFRIRPPRGWTARVDRGVLLLELGPPAAGGYAPRIHVVSVPWTDGTSPADLAQLSDWTLEQLARCASPAPGAFRAEPAPACPAGPGWDQELVTRTTRGPLAVRALRRLSLRAGRVVVFSAYADEQDFARVEPLFRACLGTLELDDGPDEPR